MANAPATATEAQEIALRTRSGALLRGLFWTGFGGSILAVMIAEGFVGIIRDNELWAILLIWRSYLVDESALSTLALLQSALKIAVALVVGWAVWRFLRSWFSAYAPPERPARLPKSL